MDLSQLDLARLQFASTSIYHFFFVPVTIGLGVPRRDAAHRVVPDGQPGLPPADQVLRDAAADQRRGRRGDRAGAGVRVRDELVGVLPVRRRRVRRAAGDGGTRGVLPGVDVPRAVGVRLERPAARRAPGDRVAGGARRAAVGAFIMAANSWMQHPVGYTTNADDRPAAADLGRATCSPTRSSSGATLHVVLASLVYGAR